MNRTILITGSRGVIGSQVSNYFQNRGYKVIGTRRLNQHPLTGKNEIEIKPWEPIDFEGGSIDCIVHIAGYYSNSLEANEIQNTFNSNVGLAVSLAQYVSKFKIPVVAVGSFAEKYPGDVGLSYYATSKIAGKDVLRGATSSANVTFDYVYLYDTYGPDFSRKKFIDLLFEIDNSKKVLPASSGLQVQDLVFIEDIAVALERLVVRSSKFAKRFLEWQIRTGEVFTLRSIARIVSEIKGFGLEINWGLLPDRERDAYSLWDCAPNLMDFSEMTKLRAGIERLRHI